MQTLPMKLQRLSGMISPQYTSLLVEHKAGSEIKRSDSIACLHRSSEDCDNDISTLDEIICLRVTFLGVPGYCEYTYIMRCILRDAYSLTLKSTAVVVPMHYQTVSFSIATGENRLTNISSVRNHATLLQGTSSKDRDAPSAALRILQYSDTTSSHKTLL